MNTAQNTPENADFMSEKLEKIQIFVKNAEGKDPKMDMKLFRRAVSLLNTVNRKAPQPLDEKDKKEIETVASLIDEAGQNNNSQVIGMTRRGFLGLVAAAAAGAAGVYLARTPGEDETPPPLPRSNTAPSTPPSAPRSPETTSGAATVNVEQLFDSQTGQQLSIRVYELQGQKRTFEVAPEKPQTFAAFEVRKEGNKTIKTRKITITMSLGSIYAQEYDTNMRINVSKDIQAEYFRTKDAWRAVERLMVEYVNSQNKAR